MSDKLHVTLAYPYTGEDGVEHRADTTVALPVEVAQNLLWGGRARPATPPAPKATPAKKAAAPRKRAAPKTPTKQATTATSATAQKE